MIITALQHYYTSFVDSRTGSAGFQIKAMSPGISAEVQSLIPRLIAYRIPTNLDERALATHPVALRYYYLNPEESILLCSQSTGNDANGRPGNFFAHTLVLDPSLFSQMPAILFWHSPFWRRTSDEIGGSLPQLEDFDAEATLDMDEIWTFLAQGKRLSLLHQLLCAVVHAESQKRRIVIIDEDNHVALWIAAVSCLLPPPYRALLSFATYHHDPHQVEFLITGTCGETAFYARPEEDLAFFVLNIQDDKISQVEHSRYADTVIDYVQQRQYEDKILPLFSDDVQRFPTPTSIDERLDSIALYHWLIQQNKPVTLTPEIVATIDTVLTTFEQSATYGEKDTTDLNHLHDLLWHDETAHDQRAQKIHSRIIALLQTHKKPTYAPLRKDLERTTSHLLDQHIGEYLIQVVIEEIQLLAQSYGDAAVTQCVNETAYLDKVLFKLNRASPIHFRLFWQCIGPHLRPTTTQSLQLLMLTLQNWQALRKDRQTGSDAKYLFEYIRAATNPFLDAWLHELANGLQTHLLDMYEKRLLEWFYYRLVQDITLQQRETYRNMLLPLFPEILSMELNNDLLAHDQSAMFSKFEQWIEYAEQSRTVSPAYIASRGIQNLKENLDAQTMQTSIATVLQNPHLMQYISVEDESMLVQKFFAHTTISSYNAQYISLFKSYRDYDGLSPQKQTILHAILAMRSAVIDETLITPLQSYLAQLPRELYEQEINTFLTTFLKTNFSDHPSSHQYTMRALFIWRYEPTYRHVYWQQLIAFFIKPISTIEPTSAIFSDWFSLSPENVLIEYFLPWLFLSLPKFLQSIQQFPAAHTIITKIGGQRISYSWYPLIHDFLQLPKGNLNALSRNIAKSMQKHIPLPKNEMDREREQALRKRVSVLFEKGAIQQMHAKNVLSLLQKNDENTFWMLYDEMLARLLLEKDVDSILELLTFWFDAPDAYWQSQFPAQHFFMYLARAWAVAKQENETLMRNTCILIDKKCTNANSSPNGIASYSWYPIVRDLLL